MGTLISLSSSYIISINGSIFGDKRYFSCALKMIRCRKRPLLILHNALYCDYCWLIKISVLQAI